MIYENYLKGRKRALWISVSNDLKYDAERDLADIGNTGIEVRAATVFSEAGFGITLPGTRYRYQRCVIGTTNSILTWLALR